MTFYLVLDKNTPFYEYDNEYDTFMADEVKIFSTREKAEKWIDEIVRYDAEQDTTEEDIQESKDDFLIRIVCIDE